MIVVSIYEPIFVNEYVTGYDRDDDKKKKKRSEQRYAWIIDAHTLLFSLMCIDARYRMSKKTKNEAFVHRLSQ